MEFHRPGAGTIPSTSRFSQSECRRPLGIQQINWFYHDEDTVNIVCPRINIIELFERSYN